MAEEIEEGAQGQTPKGKNTGWATIAYIIFFLPLLTEVKNDSFVKYHVKQGLVLFISWAIVWIFGTVIPIIGLIIAWPLSILLFILWIIGILNAVKGIEKPLPIIGKFAEYFKF